MKRLAAVGAVLIALSLAVLATARSARADTVSVSAADFEFSPKTITIQVGDTVEWNFSGMDHSVTSLSGGELDSGTKSSGSTYVHTFDAPGTYQYFCIFHGDPESFSNMVGTVNVAAAPTATATTAAPSATPSRTPTQTTTAEPTGTTTPVPSATLAPGETPSATAIPVAPTTSAGAAGAGSRPPTNVLPTAGTGGGTRGFDSVKLGALAMLAIGVTLVGGAVGSARRRR